MVKTIAGNLKHLPGCSSIALEHVTALTKSIRFKANAVSAAMDTVNGGYLKYGRFHRLHGGHSIVDIKMWQEHGLQYGVELFKDSLTISGIPLPGVETLVHKYRVVRDLAAEKWGCMNIGDGLAFGVSAIDTTLNFRNFIKDEEKFRSSSTKVAIKGATKLVVASMHGNLPLMAAGTLDVTMAAYSKLAAAATIDMSETTFHPAW